MIKRFFEGLLIALALLVAIVINLAWVFLPLVIIYEVIFG